MDILKHINSGLRNGIKTSYKIIIYTIPFYVIVDILNQTGLLLKASLVFKSMMKLLGLPPEASVVLILGFFMNHYVAIGAMAPLSLSVKQITIIGLVLGIAHNLILEAIVLSRAGTRAIITITTRILLAITTGIFINLLWN